jgi:hypothetical protein
MLNKGHHSNLNVFNFWIWFKRRFRLKFENEKKMNKNIHIIVSNYYMASKMNFKQSYHLSSSNQCQQKYTVGYSFQRLISIFCCVLLLGWTYVCILFTFCWMGSPLTSLSSLFLLSLRWSKLGFICITKINI